MDRIGDPDRRARRAGPGGRQAVRDQATAHAETGVGGHRIDSRLVVDLGATFARRYDRGAPRCRGGIRKVHAGAAATRPARAARLNGGAADAWNDKALPGSGGSGPQVPKRAAARRWPGRLIWFAARSCSTRW